jgi:hypothetical protein
MRIPEMHSAISVPPSEFFGPLFWGSWVNIIYMKSNSFLFPVRGWWGQRQGQRLADHTSWIHVRIKLREEQMQPFSLPTPLYYVGAFLPRAGSETVWVLQYQSWNCKFISFPCTSTSWFFWWVALGFELRASCLLDRNLTSWATPPALFLCGVFSR